MSTNRWFGIFLGILVSTFASTAQGQTANPAVGDGAEPRAPAKSPAVQAAEQLAIQLQKFPASREKKTEYVALFMLDSVTNQVTQIAAEPEPGYLYCGSSEWSSDGQRILFDALPTENEWSKTQMQSIELGEARPRYLHLGTGTFPTMTEDGERILFLLHPGMAGEEMGTLWVMQADGSERRKLEEYGRPKLSPDGRLCMISSIQKPIRVKLVDLSNARIYPVNLPDQQQIFSIPSWADGQTIVAMTGTEIVEAVSLFDASDPKNVRIKETLWKRKNESDLRPRSPVYSPITRRGFFIANDAEKGTAVYSYRQGDPRPAVRIEATAGRQMAGLGLAPGGRYVLFAHAVEAKE